MSGAPLVLRCLTGPDPALRLKAMTVEMPNLNVFRPYSEGVVRALFDELRWPSTDEHLERAVDALAWYPTDDVLVELFPFLTHGNGTVAFRAATSIDRIVREQRLRAEWPPSRK